MSNYPDLIVDMHTHLFNARYVPLNEILRSRSVPPGISHLVSRLILALTRKSNLNKMDDFFLEDEGDFERVMAEIAELTSEQFGFIASTAISEAQLSEGDYREVIFDAKNTLQDNPLFQVLCDIDCEFGDQQSAVELALEHNANPVTELFSKGAIELTATDWKGLFGGIKSMVIRLLKKAVSFIESAGDTLDFLLTMMRSEKRLFKRLSKYYKRHTDNYLLVHHMMDMAHPFDGDTSYDYYSEQLPRMTGLERYGEGNVVGFSAFDPLRFLRGNHDANAITQHIEKALSLGKVGFKFYPPMGYRAAGNDDRPKLEQVVDIFFDYCAEHQVPVFTHCTPEGFEAVVGKTGPNAHPRFWELALTKKPSRRNLVLCFGHAGGGERKSGNEVVRGWLSENDQEWNHEDNYARWVVDLCRRFPNVYCELSYLHEIIHDEAEKGRLKNRLIVESGRPVTESHPFPLTEKLMYGSDWHMPSMVNDIDKYLDDMVEIFSDPGLVQQSRQFFAGNAFNYLGLANFVGRARSQLNDTCANELERLLYINQ